MQIDPIVRGVGERLKKLWRRSGDPGSAATYEESCGIEPQQVDKGEVNSTLRGIPDRVGIVIVFVLIFACIIAALGGR